jgi:hypothetical protein
MCGMPGTTRASARRDRSLICLKLNLPVMSGPGSPTTSYSSGTSDLMALLDQGLQSDQSDAEENPPESPAHTVEQYDMHDVVRTRHPSADSYRLLVMQSGNSTNCSRREAG